MQLLCSGSQLCLGLFKNPDKCFCLEEPRLTPYSQHQAARVHGLLQLQLKADLLHSWVQSTAPSLKQPCCGGGAAKPVWSSKLQGGRRWKDVTLDVTWSKPLLQEGHIKQVTQDLSGWVNLLCIWIRFAISEGGLWPACHPDVTVPPQPWWQHPVATMQGP